MKHKLGGVAFDLDGTLYPNYRLNVLLVPFALKEWRFLRAFGKARNMIRKAQEKEPPVSGEPLPPDFYEAQARCTAEILKADPRLIKKRIETLIYRCWEPFFKQIRLFPHVEESLRAFRAGGLKLGLLSDFPPERKLEYLGLADIWDAILCSEHTGWLKPDPRPFWRLAENMGIPPEGILYVGNSRRCDVYGAKQAGMRTALTGSPLNLRRGQADFVFRDYRQLVNYVLS
ncbi:MAG: HAD family hydrolase [Treponema sp.]|jgi:putative hydrolase of the HAD superfamily|nr:HAD family hydrolase [Treponema sp.]